MPASTPDPHPVHDPVREVVASLSQPEPELHCKWLYDAEGSELFEQITRLPEYYLTRCEIEILDRHAGAMAAALGPGVVLVELGSGSARKTVPLLAALEAPAAWVPIDISESALTDAVTRMQQRFGGLPIVPVAADYTADVTLPPLPDGPRAGWFPGSTIGNFDREDAVAFLGRIATLLGPGGHLLIGVDVQKDPSVLIPAYDDAQGVSARFNLNLLAHVNDTTGANFDLAHWRHRATWDPSRSCVELAVVATCDTTVTVGGTTFSFAAGDVIRTERSHKWTRPAFDAIADEAGYTPVAGWSDSGDRYDVRLLRVATPD